MPRRHDNLFGRIANFQALHAAARRAARGKRKRPGAASFLANLERELLNRDQWRVGTFGSGDVNARVVAWIAHARHADTWHCAMRSSGAAGSIRPTPLKPGRPLVGVSFAAVPGTTIHRTSAPPTATGTPPTTGTTISASVSGVRFPPEPMRSRSRRARTKRPGLSMMSMVGARGRRPIPRRRLSWLTRGATGAVGLLGTRPSIFARIKLAPLLRCMSPKLALSFRSS